MIFEMLSRGSGGVAKGCLGLVVASTAIYGFWQQTDIYPRTLTTEWRNAEMKHRIAQNISER